MKKNPSHNLGACLKSKEILLFSSSCLHLLRTNDFNLPWRNSQHTMYHVLPCCRFPCCQYGVCALPCLLCCTVRSNNLTNSILSGLYSSQSGAVSISNFCQMWAPLFRKLCEHVLQMMFNQNTYIILMLTQIINHSWQLSDFIALDGQKTSYMTYYSVHSLRLQTA